MTSSPPDADADDVDHADQAASAASRSPASAAASALPAAPEGERGFVRAWLRGCVGWVLRYRVAILVLDLAISAAAAYAATGLTSDTSPEAMRFTDAEGQRTNAMLEDNFGIDKVFLLVISGDVFTKPYLERLRALHSELAAMDLDLQSLGQSPRAANTETPVAQAAADGHAAPDGFDGFGAFGEAGEVDGGDPGDPGYPGAGAWGDDSGGSIVDELRSLINAREVSGGPAGLRVEGAFDAGIPDDAGLLAAARRRLLGNPSVRNWLVDPLARHSLVMIRTEPMDSEDTSRVDLEIRRIADRHRADGFRIRVAGTPGLAAELTRYLEEDLAQTNLASLVFMLVALSLIFRHPLGTLGPILVVVLSIFWTTGLMALTHTPLTMISNIIPSFLICVGIGDAVHLQMVYRQVKPQWGDPRRAVIEASVRTGVPIIFTSLTTCVGLLSFQSASLEALRDFGVFAAFGVFVAMLQSLVLLPILLSFSGRATFGAPAQDPGRGPGVLPSLLARLDGLSAAGASPRTDGLRRRNRVLLAGVAAILLCLLGMAKLRVHHDPIAWMPSTSEARQAVAMLDGEIGGSTTLSLVVEALPGRDLKDPALLHALDELEKHILDYRDPRHGQVVPAASGILDVVRESWRALHADDPRYFRIPEGEREVSDVFTIFESASPDELKRQITVDARVARMTFAVKWLEASTYRPLQAHIQRGIDTLVGPLARVRMAGSVIDATASDDAIIRDLMRSFEIALGVITLLMMGVLRSWRLGLIAMVPNLLPILGVLAFMGFSGIGLDMSNLLIASIGISIAVDDTIHFLHHFAADYRAGGRVDAALATAFRQAGQAMLGTSVLLFLGFATLCVARLSNVVVFGLLICLTIFFAIVADLIITPAILRLCYRDTDAAKP